jgi:hypothetical protein
MKWLSQLSTREKKLARGVRFQERTVGSHHRSFVWQFIPARFSQSPTREK